MVQARDIVTMEWSLYVLYQMVLFPVGLSDTNYRKPPHFDILYRLSYLHSEWR